MLSLLVPSLAAVSLAQQAPAAQSGRIDALLLRSASTATTSGGVRSSQTPCSAHPDECRSVPGFAVIADRRVFATMAFMNAMGFDDEVKGKNMHPVRLKVRAALAAELKKRPGEARVWKRHYEKWKAPSFVYQDMSLTLTPDYPFVFVHSVRELNYKQAAKRMKDFPAVLNEFWQGVNLAGIWESVRADYLAELQKYDLGRMDSQMEFLWQYLRMPR